MNFPENLVDRLHNSKNIVVFTGAGVSAESGVATFRDALTGLWARFDPMQLATPQAFVRDPALVWGWYEWRRQLLLQAEPNPAHLTIAQLQQKVANFQLVTQNVDDLHECAGSKNVIHLHGCIFSPRCFDCAVSYSFSAAPDMQQEVKIPPPACTSCGGMIRPGVVWFGEALPQGEFQAACEAAAQADLMLVVGTSGLVQPAAMLPALALRNNATVVHINPDAHQSGQPNEFALRGTAGNILPLLLAQLHHSK